MASKDQTMRWKVDVSEFKKNIQDAKRQIQLANAEFKTATAGAKDWASSMGGLEAKLKQLETTSKNQRTVLEQLEKEYELVKKEMGETSPAAERLKIQIENQKAAIAKTERQTETYGQALNEMKKEQAEAETPMAKLTKTIESQEKELEALKDEYKNAVLQYGKNSDEAKELANQIDSLSGELKDNKKSLEQVDKAADSLDQSFDDADKAADGLKEGFSVLKGAAAELLADGIRLLIRGMEDLAKATFNAGADFESEMSKVQAISGSTSDDMDKLKDKAKEMGSTTKFTATEAGQALEYMAMAGWKTDDMLDGLEGIMNLAAASGEDLATTSDIVTDALTAFGLKADQAGRFADVLAATSSNANTNVSMLGESFKYVAPVAGSLGFSVEDVSVALGLMANSGIKASTAGTTLRQLLTNMAKPTKSAANAMDLLGVSLDDGQGNMKTFGQIMDDLRKGFGELKIPADEFKRQMDLLDQAFEDGTITEEDYTKQTEELATQAFGAEGALKAQAAASLAGTRGMSGLLAIVNSSAEDYNALTTAIQNCDGAASSMATTMEDNVSGQLTKLQSKIEGIMIKVFDEASGSMKDGINTVSDALDRVDWDKFADGVGSFAEAIADAFAYIVDHSDQILDILEDIAVAFVTYKAVSIITDVVSSFSSLVNGIKAADGAMSLFNGTLAMNPIGLVAGALGGLVMVALNYKDSLDKAKESLTTLTEEEQAFIEEMGGIYDSYKKAQEARDNANLAIDTEYGKIKDLVTELDDLTLSNGKVKKGYEDRVSYILNELQNATGIEADMIGNQILNYNSYRDSVEEVIDAKRREAIVSANYGAYQEAISNVASSYKNYQDAVNALDAKQKELAETNSELAKINYILAKSDDEQIEILESMGITYNQLLDQKDELSEKQKTLAKDVRDERDVVEQTGEVWRGYAQTIQNFEGVQAAMASGDVDVLNEALLNLQYGLKTTTNASKEELQAQADKFDELFESMSEAVNVDGSGVTQQMVDNMAEMRKRSHDELDKANGVFKEDAEANVESYTNEWEDPAQTRMRDLTLAMTTQGIDAFNKANFAEAGEENADDYLSTWEDPAQERMRESVLAMTTDGIDALTSADFYKPAKEQAEDVTQAIKDEQPLAGSAAYDTGDKIGQGFNDGMASWKDRLFAKARELIRGTIDTGNREARTGSPSKETMWTGEMMGLGFEKGLDKTEPAVVKAGRNMIRNTVNAMEEESQNGDVGAPIEDALKQIEKLSKKGKLTLVAEGKIWKDTIALLQEGTKEYKKASKEMASVRKELNAELKKAQKEYSADIEAVYAEMNTAIDKARENYDKSLGSLQDSIFNTFSLFDAAKLNEGSSGKTLVKNLKDQIRAIEEYDEAIDEIERKVTNASEADRDEFFRYIESVGVAELNNLKALADMSGEELDEYVKLFNKKRRVSDRAVGDTLRDDLAWEMQEAIDEARYATADKIDELSKALIDSLKQMGLDTSDVMKDVGEAIVDGLDDGISNAMYQVVDGFKNQIRDLIKDTKEELGIASPSRVFADEVGKWIPEGIAEGFKIQMPKAETSMRDSLAGAVAGLRGSIGGAAGIGAGMAAGSGTGNVIFNQYNNSPKALDRLTIYRETNSLLFSAKARLA